LEAGLDARKDRLSPTIAARGDRKKGAGADRGRGGVERTAAPNGSTPARRHF